MGSTLKDNLQSVTLSDGLIDFGNGIYCIDSGYVRPRLAAIHLIESQGHIGIVDTGTAASLPRVLAALDTLGFGPDAVDLVILTHIHLDHAGGAGAMMQAFPQARLVVHPRGAPHMAEPSRLMAGVEAVYGSEQARQMYGKLIPIPSERIIEAPDGTELTLGGRALYCIDTPGHAKHHIAILDRQENEFFTGDTFGIAYPETNGVDRPLIFPTTTPTQFDPQALRHSIRRMLDFKPRALYLTHFSRVEAPQVLGADLLRRIDSYVDIALRAKTASDIGAEIRQNLARLILDECRTHGLSLEDEAILDVWHGDITLNAQGLMHWAASQP